MSRARRTTSPFWLSFSTNLTNSCSQAEGRKAQPKTLPACNWAKSHARSSPSKQPAPAIPDVIKFSRVGQSLIGEILKLVLLRLHRLAIALRVHRAAGELISEVASIDVRGQFGHERRFYFSQKQGFPVQFSKPRMLLDLLCTVMPQPLGRILVQHLLEEVMQLRRGLASKGGTWCSSGLL